MNVMDDDNSGEGVSLMNLMDESDLCNLANTVVSDLFEENVPFSERLEKFKSKIQDVLHYALESEERISNVAIFLEKVQGMISTEPVLSLPKERVMLYVGPDTHSDPLLLPSILVDFLWMLDQESAGTSDSVTTLRKNIIMLSKKLINVIIPITLIRERIELEFQHELGVVADLKNVLRREVRMRTSLLYVQKKFNLFREESEGFSKLVVEVFQTLEYVSKKALHLQDKQPEMDRLSDVFNSKLMSLMGYFSIDPNRVLDVIIDLFASNIEDYWEFFLTFLKKSPWGSQIDTKSAEVIHFPLKSEILRVKLCGHNNNPAQKYKKNMFLVAALLIKNQLASLDYLYPYLTPLDSEFDNLATEYYSKLKEREGKTDRFKSQVLSGQLGDMGVRSTASIISSQDQSSTSNNNVSESFSCKMNQKAMLTRSLLEIGDIKTAFSIINRIPQIVIIYPDISERICRLLYEIIAPYDFNPLTAAIKLKDTQFKYVNTTSVRLATLSDRIVSCPKRSNVLRYKYFYPNWKDDLPVISDVLRFATQCRIYLAKVGLNLYMDPVLLGKLIRIGSRHVQAANKYLQSDTPPTDKFYLVNHKQVLDSWLNIISIHIFPAISRADPNSANSFELWKMVKEYPTKTRYALYGELKHRIYDEYPELKISRAACLKDCRYIMIRISKDMIKQSGRQIAKVVHSNPVVSFTYILRQTTAYDNMIPHIVDATRYLTDLEFDIMAYCILDALSSRTGPRFEGHHSAIAPWLKYLANFTGVLFRKHSIDLTGLLIYVMSQMLKGNVYDLVIIQELISNMSGTKPLDDITNTQVETLSGGDTLKRQVLLYENTKAVKKSGLKLLNALIDTGLVAKLPIIISQMRMKFTSHDPGDEYERNLKAVVWLADHCGSIVFQYMEFLCTNNFVEVFSPYFPSLEKLITDYRLAPEYAFTILRPILQNQQENKMAVDNEETPNLDFIKNIYPSMDIISPTFYMTFWTLSGRCLFNPSSQYLSELRSQQKAKKSHEQYLTPKNSIKLKKKIEKISSLIKSLESEQATQEALCASTLSRLKVESKTWFPKNAGHKEVINFIFQCCLYPRLILSAADAVFTAKFILLMHSLSVPIGTISLYDNIFSVNVIHAIIFSTTEHEAKNYGFFLERTLETLSSWRKSEELFEKEAIGTEMPGFLKKWPSEDEAIDYSEAEFVHHDEFKQAMRKWHLKMFRAFVTCLRSGEYVKVRNSIIILDKISDYFPITKEMGKHIEYFVQELEKTEKREDLKHLTKSYYTKMQIKKNIWIYTSEFYPQAGEKKLENAPKAQCDPKPHEDSTRENTHAVSSENPKAISSETETKSEKSVFNEGCKEVPSNTQKESKSGVAPPKKEVPAQIHPQKEVAQSGRIHKEQSASSTYKGSSGIHHKEPPVSSHSHREPHFSGGTDKENKEKYPNVQQRENYKSLRDSPHHQTFGGEKSSYNYSTRREYTNEGSEAPESNTRGKFHHEIETPEGPSDRSVNRKVAPERGGLSERLHEKDVHERRKNGYRESKSKRSIQNLGVRPYDSMSRNIAHYDDQDPKWRNNYFPDDMYNQINQDHISSNIRSHNGYRKTPSSSVQSQVYVSQQEQFPSSSQKFYDETSSKYYTREGSWRKRNERSFERTRSLRSGNDSTTHEGPNLRVRELSPHRCSVQNNEVRQNKFYNKTKSKISRSKYEKKRRERDDDMAEQERRIKSPKISKKSPIEHTSNDDPKTRR